MALSGNLPALIVASLVIASASAAGPLGKNKCFAMNNDGNVVIQAEYGDFVDGTENWAIESELDGYSDDGYIIYGPRRQMEYEGRGNVEYPVYLKEGGEYYVRMWTLRPLREPLPDEEGPYCRNDQCNDCHVFDGENFVKLFTGFYFHFDKWNWTGQFDFHHSKSAPVISLKKGVNTLRIAGRSRNFGIDRIVLRRKEGQGFPFEPTSETRNITVSCDNNGREPPKPEPTNAPEPEPTESPKPKPTEKPRGEMPDKPCGKAFSLPRGSSSVLLRISNYRKKRVVAYWMDMNGVRRGKKMLKSKATAKWKAFEGAYFVVKTLRGNCLKYFFVAGKGNKQSTFVGRKPTREPTPTPTPTPSPPSDPCSDAVSVPRTGQTNVRMKIINNRKGPIYAYWIDRRGQRKQTKRIGSKKNDGWNVFEGAHFVVRKLKGHKCLDNFSVEAPEQGKKMIVTIN